VAQGSPRDYSMASLPQEGTLEFHVRVMPGGSVSQRVAAGLKVGDAVRVSGPLGTAYLRQNHAGPMLCIAGGSGLAPIRSIVRAALEAGFERPLHLYFGARAERDVYLEEELAQLASRHPNFHGHIVLSEAGSPLAAGTRLPRRAGLVTDAVALDLADLSGFKVYVAGPPPMVDAASLLARSRGVAPSDIHADAFFPAAQPALAEAAR
jgi:ferredoxin-NAD(P)+ reductase (naphthalene dioxygenase ferredoxin-specific)